ncbi:hypothetical protein BH11ACT2_BH11ACT2_19850 [soil metagenome]
MTTLAAFDVRIDHVTIPPLPLNLHIEIDRGCLARHPRHPAFHVGLHDCPAAALVPDLPGRLRSSTTTTIRTRRVHPDQTRCLRRIRAMAAAVHRRPLSAVRTWGRGNPGQEHAVLARLGGRRLAPSGHRPMAATGARARADSQRRALLLGDPEARNRIGWRRRRDQLADGHVTGADGRGFLSIDDVHASRMRDGCGHGTTREANVSACQ